MKFRDLIFRYSFVIVGGFLVFYLDSLEFVGSIITKLLILALVVFKSLFFFSESFRKILEATSKNVAYHYFLVFMGVNIALIIVSFGVDFLCLYQVEPLSFRGVSENLTLFRRIFEFMYFSLLNFSNFGFGDITPISLLGKSMVSIEIIISVITIIFILSDFVSLKESIHNEGLKGFYFRKKKK